MHGGILISPPLYTNGDGFVHSPLSTQAMDGVAAGVNAAKKKRRKKNKKKAVAQEADANSEDSSAEEVSETERKPFANQSTKPSASNADELYQTRRLDPMAMTIAECVKVSGKIYYIVFHPFHQLDPSVY